MQGNDLASFSPISQATMFEGVLASEPEGLSKIRARVALTAKNWEQYISFWKVNEIPVKHAIDLINRYNVGIVVYTLLPDYLVDSIEKWLIRKGISTTVTAYKSIEELAYDLRFFRPYRRCTQQMKSTQRLLDSDPRWLHPRLRGLRNG